MSFFNLYKKSNENEQVKFSLTIEDLAKIIVTHSYGTHRMVCALIEEQQKKFPDSELAVSLKEAVSKYTI